MMHEADKDPSLLYHSCIRQAVETGSPFQIEQLESEAQGNVEARETFYLGSLVQSRSALEGFISVDNIIPF